MIVECILFFASLQDPLKEDDIFKVKECQNYLPTNVIQYSKDYVEHFETHNIERAVKVSWCESRGKTFALNKGNSDSGLFQVIPSTWNWVATEYDLPKFDSYILTYNNIPVENIPFSLRRILISNYPDLYKLNKVQFVPYYNFLISKILVQDIHSRNDYWKPWTPSKECWSSKNWNELWKAEE